MTWYDIFGLTDRGALRQENEDHILLGRFIKNEGGAGLLIGSDDDHVARHGLLLAVADGVGGEAGGALASRHALESLEGRFAALHKIGPGSAAATAVSLTQALNEACFHANKTVLAFAAADPQLQGMGCTLSGVCLGHECMLVFNAGDSRVYHVRGGYARQLTTDHSTVSAAVRSGLLTDEQARHASCRHEITNCVGSRDFTVDVHQHPLPAPDQLLVVCSDGLHDLVTVDEMEQLMAGAGSAREITRRLYSAAMEAGGNDNISLLVVRCFSDRPPDVAPFPG